MTATAPAGLEASKVPLACGLLSRVGALRDDALALWHSTPEELPQLGARVAWHRRLRNGWAAGQLIEALARDVEGFPEGEAERASWRERVRRRILQFGRARLAWPESFGRLTLGDSMADVATAFVREARASHPQVPYDGLWQALRNVWIGNGLQHMLGRPVVLRPGLFAYSMLYPLTDNVLDDPRRDGAEKRAFNRRFGRRLAGEALAPASAAEEEVFGLVARVESEFPRAAFPDVHESLLAIHGAQSRSLRQHEAGLAEAETLSISAEKGGASVLADLYLVTGGADAGGERFAFRYGVCLQLLDDLQDVDADLQAGHTTPFTLAVARGPLDRTTARLARFVDRVLDEPPRPDAADTIDLVRRNCRALLVDSIAERPERFTRSFRRRVEAHWPFSLRVTRRLHRRAERRFAAATRRLRERPGAQGSPERDALLVGREPLGEGLELRVQRP